MCDPLVILQAGIDLQRTRFYPELPKALKLGNVPEIMVRRPI